jgi:O-methyltransferase
VKRAIKALLARFGYKLVHEGVAPDMVERGFAEVYRASAPFTMGTNERLYTLYKAVQYLEDRGVPGAIVECGVWRGGSAMAAALTLLGSGSTERAIYLYDTFAGMPEPGARDVDFQGRDARPTWQRMRSGDANQWCLADLAEVRRNMVSTGYPPERLHFVVGRVEETIPAQVPEQIALLRLDTDWYESTYHELVHLYPRLAPGGVLIVDDYGFWRGSREATDQYFREQSVPTLLTRVDHTARMAVKPADARP